jgi:hypothetical protein
MPCFLRSSRICAGAGSSSKHEDKQQAFQEFQNLQQYVQVVATESFVGF